MKRFACFLTGLTLCSAVCILTTSCQEEEEIVPYLEFSVPEISELYMFKDQSFEFSFDVTGVYIEPLLVSASASGGIKGFNISGENANSHITVTGTLSGDSESFSVEVRSGNSVRNRCTVNIIAYLASLTGFTEGNEFSGDGRYETFDFAIQTNLPEDRWGDLVIETNADWLALDREGLSCTAILSENRTHYPRSCSIILSEQNGEMTPIEYSIRQDWYTTLEPSRPDVVRFAEKAFKAAMLDIADLDDDGEVSFSEAETIREVDITGKGISDLTGLEAFSNVRKLDAQNNDIRNADILKNLHYLYWLDLKGNPKLESFDITGCSVFFEHFEYAKTRNLKFTLTNNQVIEVGQQNWQYCRRVYDPSESSCYDSDKRLVLIKRHTKGSGHLAYVISGFGFLDKDIEDGTFERLAKSYWEQANENDRQHKDYREYWDDNKEYYDVYYYTRIEKTRTEYKSFAAYFELAAELYSDVYNLIFNDSDYPDNHQYYNGVIHLKMLSICKISYETSGHGANRGMQYFPLWSDYPKKRPVVWGIYSVLSLNGQTLIINPGESTIADSQYDSYFIPHEYNLTASFFLNQASEENLSRFLIEENLVNSDTLEDMRALQEDPDKPLM